MIIGVNEYGPIRIPIKRPCVGYYLRWYYNGWHYFFFKPGTYTLITEGEKYRTIGTRQISMGSGQQSRQAIAGIRTIMNTREVYLLTVAGWMNIRIIPGSVNIYTNQIAGEELEFIAIIGSKEISYATGYTPVPGDGSIPEIPVVPPSIDYCEVIVGDQVWMCYNFDSAYPGSKVYNDNEANRAIYGGLYSYDQIMSPGFCPPGWHVPTIAELETLIAFIGGAAVGGGVLKEVGITHWNAPNTGAVDTYGFSLLGAGFYRLGDYYGLKDIVHLWVIDSDPSLATSYYARYDSAGMVKWALTIGAPLWDRYCSVRLVKDTPAEPFTDWYLASEDDMANVYANLHAFGVGGFNNAFWYWTSSEQNAGSARRVRFSDGLAGSVVKGTTADAVRAVRTFTAALGAYSLRDTGPAGGWIFYITGTTYYEAAPSDQSTNYQWSNIVALFAGTSKLVGTGDNNTDLIIAQPGHIDSAAKLCHDLIIYR